VHVDLGGVEVGAQLLRGGGDERREIDEIDDPRGGSGDP
jgi:hypothetical protein